MRHRKKKRHLNRNSNHFRMMFRNMIISLIKYETIITTIQKAKELRRLIEPIINIAKCNSITNKRVIFSQLRNRSIILKLFNEIAIRFINRNGGYTRIIKCGFRKGDKANMAYIFLINDLIIQNLDINK